MWNMDKSLRGYLEPFQKSMTELFCENSPIIRLERVEVTPLALPSPDPPSETIQNPQNSANVAYHKQDQAEIGKN